MATLAMAAALNQALDQEMERDDRVFLIGEDIPGPAGGPFGLTKGLSAKYGLDRVLDSPISEQAIIGTATGAALAGMRPVAEIMICESSACAWISSPTTPSRCGSCPAASTSAASTRRCWRRGSPGRRRPRCPERAQPSDDQTIREGQRRRRKS
jgi:Transketolase, pyrimidine binding domain